MAMSKQDEDRISAAKDKWNKANAAGDQAGMDAAHKEAESVRNKYNYSGGDDGSQHISLSGSGGSKGNSSYTPRDSSGNDYASMAGMSDIDRAALDAATAAWNKTSAAGDQAGMDAAHRQAEAIRKRYNYSGGEDGSQYIPGTQFTYANAPSYTNRYQDKIDELTREILQREAFSYDPEKDPLYLQYKDSYTRNGQRAMQDTLGQVSARTGGLASSYAGSAAQQSWRSWWFCVCKRKRKTAGSCFALRANRQRFWASRACWRRCSLISATMRSSIIALAAGRRSQCIRRGTMWLSQCRIMASASPMSISPGCLSGFTGWIKAIPGKPAVPAWA